MDDNSVISGTEGLSGAQAAAAPADTSAQSTQAMPAGATPVAAPAPQQATPAPASGPAPAQPGTPHAGLRNMLQSLFEGMDAFAKAAATGGREGGVQEIEQLQNQRKEMALRQQAGQREQSQADAMIKAEQARTNMTIAQTTILQHNAPAEYDKLVNENRAALYDLYVNKLKINPLFSQAIIEGQDTGTFMNSLSSKLNGDLVNNTAIPVHDNGKLGGAGAAHVFGFDALRKTNVPTEMLAPTLQNLQSQIDMAKSILPNGENDQAVKVAQGQLSLLKQGATINGADFYNLNNNMVANLMSRVENQRQLMDFQKQKADLQKTQNDAANSALPKNSDEAQARATAAAQAYRANPTPATKQAMDNSNEQLQNLRRLDISKTYAEAAARVTAQKTADNDDLKVVAKAIANDPNNLTQLKDITSLKGAERLRLYSMIKQINPQFDPGVLQNRVKFLGEFTDPNGKTAMGIDSANTFMQHAGDLLDKTASFRTTNIPAINAPFNKLRNVAGDASYSDFKSSLDIVRSEYVNAIKAGFAPSVEDSKEGRDIMSDSSSPAQIEAATKSMAHTISRRMDSTNEKFKTVMGQNYPNLLTPAAAESAKKLGLDLSKFSSGGQIGKNQPTATKYDFSNPDNFPKAQ